MARKLAALAGAATLVALAGVNEAEAASLTRPVLKHRFQISTYKVAWYEGKGAWTRRPRVQLCRDLRAKKAENRCFRHREGYRFHLQRLAALRVRLWPRPRVPQLVAAQDSGLVNAFLCIHRYEGPWDANTGNGYEGGLQFGHSEWQTYGGQYAAHAYDASPAQQIAAGIAYYRVSGFSPWPNTARACGLL